MNQKFISLEDYAVIDETCDLKKIDSSNNKSATLLKGVTPNTSMDFTVLDVGSVDVFLVSSQFSIKQLFEEFKIRNI